VIGHSWGGTIACHAAAARPERVAALVLVDSGHLDYADWPGARPDASLEELVEEAERERLRRPSRAVLREELALELAEAPWAIEAVMEAIEELPDGSVASVTTGATRGAALYHLVAAKVSATWPLLQAGGIPTLLLLATEPAELRVRNERAAEGFRAVFPSADVVPVEGAGHSMLVDLGEGLGELVGAWLERRGLV
jgi:pimeloyl-ACP methyl ester carboxylesterase